MVEGSSVINIVDGDGFTFEDFGRRGTSTPDFGRAATTNGILPNQNSLKR
jgi:hypothetical protein